MIIFGAGLAGCLAGCLNQNASIYEANDEVRIHKAVLRFRSNNIGEAIGIDFKKVKIYKGIWHNGENVALSPRHISLYSRKVSDAISYRSICNLETDYRWIAPDNLHEILIEQCESRIEYGMNLQAAIGEEEIISTIPINILAKMLGVEIKVDSHINRIFVSRYEIPECDVWMTYYYTDPTVLPYRASISGNILIVESIWPIREEDIKTVVRSFGLKGMPLEPLVENYKQPNGKMTKINEAKRRLFIANATLQHKIYSLGRFATWRPLVLDDVYHDILVIKKLMNEDIYYNYRALA